MKRKVLQYILAVVMITSLVVGASLGIYSYYSMNHLLEQIKTSSISGARVRLEMFDKVMGQVERELERQMTGELQRLTGLIDPNKLSSADSLTLAALAHGNGLDELYLINRRGDVFATSFTPDLNFSLFNLDTNITRELQQLYGSGRTISERVCTSKKTGRLNKYIYYSPPGSDYILEGSVDIRRYINNSYSRDYQDFIFRRLFSSLTDGTPYLTGIDLYNVAGTQGWSLLNMGAQKNLSELFPPGQPARTIHHLTNNHESIFIPLKLDALTTGLPNLPEDMVLYMDFDFTSLHLFKLRLVAVILLLIFIISLPVFFITARFVKKEFILPLLNVKMVLSRMGKGDFDTNVPLLGHFEMVEIAGSVNQVSQNLKDRDEELLRHRNHLDEMVNRRTEELTRLNERLEGEVSEHRRTEEQLRRRDLLLETTGRVAHTLLISQDFRQDMSRVLELVGKNMHMDRVYIARSHIDSVNGNEVISLKWEWCAPGVETHIGQPQWQNFNLPGQFPREYERLLKGVILSGNRSDQQARIRAFMDEGQKKFMALVPIFVNETLWGLMGVDDQHTEHEWEKSEEVVLMAVAASLGAAIARDQHMKLLHKSVNQAQELSRLKSEFLANISHEIRTPLNSVLGFADLIYESSTNDKERHYADVIRSGGRSLLTLINDILDLSKIEAGRLDISPRPMSLVSLIEEMKKVFSLKVSQKGLRYHQNIITAFPEYLLMDEARVRQILFNLIGNAVKFTHAGGITINLDFTQNSAQRVDVVIVITDTGIGIPPEQQEKVFEAFRQQNGQENRQYEGTGLGLTITRRLVQMMNGRINLESIPGRGSSFTVLFREVEVVDSPRGQLYKSEQIGNELFLPGVVAVADDMASNRAMITEFLADSGLTVLEAGDGHALVELLQRQHPQVAIVDMKMPGWDGRQTLEQIRQRVELDDIKVVAFATAAQAESSGELIKAGFSDVLYKPLNRSSLITLLARLLPTQKKLTEDDNDKKMIVNHELASRLVYLLRNELGEKWEKLYKSRSMDELEEFGKELLELASLAGLQPVYLWSQRLVECTNSFNINGLHVVAADFTSLADQGDELLNTGGGNG